MNVQPGAAFTDELGVGTTGLVGTIAVGIYQGDTATVALHTTSINEIGMSGVYVATLTAPSSAGQYTIMWSLDGTLSPDQVYPGDITVTRSAPGDPPTGDTYADETELARILKIRAPSTEQTAAMTRVLLAATGEINSEIDLDDDTDLAGWQIALATEVCLERAVEHWQQEESPFGIIGLGSELGGTHTATDSWNRHANKLAPLKNQWGMA